MTPPKERLPLLDNARALLILLVVLGHLWEPLQFRGRHPLYLLLYSFHMPAFVLISGACYSPKSPRVIFEKFFLPYLLFQPVYLLFNAWKYQQIPTLQYLTPAWILWYLFSMGTWYAAAAIIRPEKNSWWVAFGLSIAGALAAGFYPRIGYFLSLSRTLVLFPFFLLGMRLRSKRSPLIFRPATPNARLRVHKWLCFALSLLGTALLLQHRAQIDERWLYHCDPYAQPGYTVWLRAGLLVLGCMQSFSLLFLMPNRPITLFSQMGQSTLPVYLLHGILVKYADCRGWLQALPLPLLTGPLLAAAMALLLSSRPVARGFQMLQNLPPPSRKSK